MGGGRLAAALCAAVLLGALTLGSAAAGTYRMKLVEIVDRSGFERPMVAARVAVPVGWSARSKVAWLVRNFCAAIPVVMQFSARSRDGRQGFDIYPTVTWSWNNMAAVNRRFADQLRAQMQSMGIPYMPIPTTPTAASKRNSGCRNGRMVDAGEMLRQVGMGELRRGAVKLDARRRTDLMAGRRVNAAQRDALGIEIVSREDIAEVLIGFNRNGQDYVEVMRGFLTAMQSTMPSMSAGGIPMINGQGIGTISAFHAPNGKLDFSLFEVIAASVAVDPRWQSRVLATMRNIARINREGIARRAAISRKTNNEIRRMLADSYAKQSKSQDRLAQKFTNYLRGQEVFVDKSTGEQVTLPNTHRYNWRLNDGTYLLTDDPNFNPYQRLRIGGRRLEVRR